MSRRLLLGWGDALHSNDTALDSLAVEVAEHNTKLTPSFALAEPDEDLCSIAASTASRTSTGFSRYRLARHASGSMVTTVAGCTPN